MNLSVHKLTKISDANIASLPRTHEILRWQSKINAWHSIKPEWAEQMGTLIKKYIDEAGVERVLQLAIQDFNFKGLKELLGKVPESTEDELAKTFHQRLDRIKQAVLDRLILAKQSLPQPEKFAAEFRNLKEAETEIGEALTAKKGNIRQLTHELMTTGKLKHVKAEPADGSQREAGGVHIIQAFFSDDTSEEVQIQGRTSRQGKSGTYSLILAESEVRELALDPARLRNMQAQECYQALCQARDTKQADLAKELEGRLKKARDFDDQSHAYFDALLQAKSSLAKDRLKDLYKELGCSAGGEYHFVCCYDESGSMTGEPWQELLQAHSAFMQTLQNHTSARVSIVQFACYARTVLELGDVGQAAGTELKCKPGGTAFEPALEEVLRLMHLGQQQYPSLTPVLLFMSDGENGDGDCIQTMTNMQHEFPSLVFHAVIFGQEDSTALRGMVGAVANGQFHVSIDGVELEKTFTSIGSGLEYTGQK
eukprot:Skav200220  [mRNA]  locus=scaffold3745:326750:344325:- [translate_table: standard]